MAANVWVLGDSRAGNTNQAIALAQELHTSYEVKNIEYNRAHKLPNFLLSIKPIHIKRDILKSLAATEDWPRLIISSGRRTAPLALYLKKCSNNKSKIIQIMQPMLPLDKFDLIVIPQHDSISESSPNIIRVMGALTNSNSRIPQGVEDLRALYPSLNKFIAVLLGGNSKSYKFSLQVANELIEKLRRITEDQSIPLLINFSRRTPDFIKARFMEEFSYPHVIHDYNTAPKTSVYFGILGDAEYIISTADSISMCSEVASSGKPLYIFCPSSFNLKKHRFFIQQLVDLGIARMLDDSVEFLNSYYYPPLNEAAKIADIIKKEILVTMEV